MGFEVFLGDGARGFASAGFVDVSPAAGMFAAAAVDVTGDGKLDLVLGTQYTGHVLVYRNDTAGTKSFRRGDVNGDGQMDLTDPIFLLSHLFLAGPAPACADAADATDDGSLDLSDAIGLLSSFFLGAGPLSDPYDACGADPTADDLGCQAFPACP